MSRHSFSDGGCLSALDAPPPATNPRRFRMSPAQEIARRRTFAIISHPDAGKTTLTEKFLLYGNAVHLAGSVTARKNQRSTTSDWMALERQRGISVSSTVLQFDFNGHAVNLLDTPGHKDFSEDTYRVLTAVDAALMVIDAAKGIEPQTRKLFEVCRRRGVPIFTFINKCDRPTRDPLELLDELESVLGLPPTAVTWPLGSGPSFKGIYDLRAKEVNLFERTPRGAYRSPESISSLSDPLMKDTMDPDDYENAVEQLEMLEGAGHAFDLEAIHAGQQTPVYFGSAVNNFGVERLLKGFLDDSIPPTTRTSVAMTSPGLPAPTVAKEVDVLHPKFSGFVFKIQANMDPKHRDRIAFIRVCSGKFERDMVVTHQRTGKSVRLSSAHKLFGQDRETVDIAWPGDVIGLVGHDAFGIGDTLTEDRTIAYDEIPRFAPEVFSWLTNPVSGDAKKYRAGVRQLLLEGVMQSFEVRHAPPGATLLAAVGPLQFEVVQARLESEYKAKSKLTPAPFEVLRWLEPHPSLENPGELLMPGGVSFGTDKFDNAIILFPNQWTMDYFTDKNPDLVLHDQPIEQVET